MSTKYPQGLINGTPPYTTGNFSGVWTLEQLAQKYYFFGDGVSNSLRFRSSASAYLSRTPAAAGNQKTWTWSGWVKRGILSTGNARLLWGGNSTTDGFTLTWTATDTLYVWNYAASTTNLALTTSAVLRDPSAWYHIVLSVDTTQATDVNRVRLYVNGVQYTFGTTTWCAQNTSLLFNAANQNTIGYSPPYGGYFDGYMAEVNFIDGQALDPSYFGVVAPATGVWSPKRYSGNYGLNGFYLPFSNGTSTTTLGYDSSGNGNNWTTNNISLTAGSTYDWMLDSPTPFAGTSYGVGNYAVLNPLNASSSAAISDGNLKISSADAQTQSSLALPLTGKWYFEYTAVGVSGAGNGPQVGLTGSLVNSDFNYGVRYSKVGQKNVNGTWSAYGSSWSAGSVIGVAYDADASSVTFYLNNTSQGVISVTSGYVYYAFVYDNGSNGNVINFGQRPFAYTPPSGYKSLCSFNLPGPTINNGASYMAATLYTGNGSAQSITNTVNGISFQPDWVWIKSRSSGGNHSETDSVRGVSKQLFPNLTDAEGNQTDQVTSFNVNGFSLGANASGTGSVNVNAVTYVGWQWKAGGAAVTNTAGSITSSVSANTTSGFSVVTCAASASQTVGHGLGIAPSMIIVKSRTSGSLDWYVYHASTGNTGFLNLDTTGAFTTNSTVWNNTSPTSTVFTLGSGFVAGTWGNIVAYCFAAIPGYSAFGSYTGNGSTDGPFVYCGFRPRFVVIKNSTTAGTNWLLWDSSCNTYNAASIYQVPSASLADQTSGADVDILSNGFKVRNSSGAGNTNGATIIYAAFAENPFKYSLAR